MALRHTYMSRALRVALLSLFISGPLTSALSGCSGAASQRAAHSGPPTPDWVLSPPEGLCGLGSAKSHPSRAVARTLATARGRAALASRVEVQVKGLLRSFEDEEGVARTQRISAHSVSQGLIGSRVVKEHLRGAELLVLVCIGGDQVLEAIEREVETREVSPARRRHLRARSEETFQALEAQMREAFSVD